VGTSQAQVFCHSLATGRSRDDMIKMKGLPDDNLRRVAIFTPLARSQGN